MRLIDADAYKAHIMKVAEWNGSNSIVNKIMCQSIDEQPTAYDVDEKIMLLIKIFEEWFGGNWDMAPYLVKTIETVKTVKPKGQGFHLEEILNETLEKLHDTGGCDGSDDYAKGWDDAITEAERTMKKKWKTLVAGEQEEIKYV
ncbi:hypothetical protein E5329_23795 [Petralouisia muris]|uniref:Uncharacterized protein n=1 Tax=Petralouisia muris TaxID=3032872 RepID=A0AC61RPD4_9FIRM|nr:hypothetical protein [Petralouisia muris]TGY90864.1 hypothetical protein E5329_23795 [Petralouisia muris]